MMGQESNIPIRGAIIGSLISIFIAIAIFALPYSLEIIASHIHSDLWLLIAMAICLPLLPLMLMTGLMSYRHAKTQISAMRAKNRFISWKLKTAHILGTLAAAIACFTTVLTLWSIFMIFLAMWALGTMLSGP